MKKTSMTQEMITLASAEDYDQMKDHAPAWMEYLGISSPEDIARMRREGTWTGFDYMNSTPPLSPSP